jgi:hypothetical protein
MLLLFSVHSYYILFVSITFSMHYSLSITRCFRKVFESQVAPVVLFHKILTLSLGKCCIYQSTYNVILFRNNINTNEYTGEVR